MFDWVLNTPMMYDPVHNNSESYKVLTQLLHRFQFYLQLASPAAQQSMTLKIFRHLL